MKEQWKSVIGYANAFENVKEAPSHSPCVR